MKEYKLHSKGENWVHFRSDPKSICESFSVTFCHDGTVVMHGDYGILVWRRYGMPRIDYGFPNKRTNIDYFAEKCMNQGQKITDWSKERAIKEIEDDLVNYREQEDEYPQWKIDDLLDALNSLEEYDEIKMYDLLNSFDPDGNWTEGKPGIDYTSHFVFQYEVLKNVSDEIFEALYKPGEKYIEDE